MKEEQTKTLIINILTAVVVGGVLVAGYLVFVKKEIPTADSVAPSVAEVAKIAEETALIGTEIDYTVRDLGELASAVASSNIIFDLPAFKNLQDFSVPVPAESIGRTNPFIPTEWKLKLKALGEKGEGAVTTTQPVAAPAITPAITPEPPLPTPIATSTVPEQGI